MLVFLVCVGIRRAKPGNSSLTLFPAIDNLTLYIEPAGSVIPEISGKITQDSLGAWMQSHLIFWGTLPNTLSNILITEATHFYNNPGNYLWNDGLDHATNFFAGFADIITLNTTAGLRRFLGQDAFVDTSSAAYVIGGFTGGALAVGITLGAGSTLLAGRAGLSGLIGLSSGTSALQMTAQVYAVTQSIYGISLAGLKTYNWANNSNVLGVGSLTTWDALLFAPAVGATGRGLSKLGSSLFKAGAPLQKTSLVASKADDAAGVAKQATIKGADDIAFMGKGNWEYVPDLTHVTGKTAASRNRAIGTLIKEDLTNLRLTHQPRYSPFIPRGLAKKDMGTQIGYKSFSSRDDLRRVIVHEELHHRWFNRGIPGPKHHSSDFVPDEKFYRVVERYFRMRGWD